MPTTTAREWLISPEIRALVEGDLKFFSRCACTVLKDMMKYYQIEVPDLMDKLGIDLDTALRFMHQPPFSKEECVKIFDFITAEFFPLERTIRDLVLDQYNRKLKVLHIKTFIQIASERLKKDGSTKKHLLSTDREREINEFFQVDLVAENAGLTLYEIGSYPGRYRVWLQLTDKGNDLKFSWHRVNDQDETVGGGPLNLNLPKNPEAITEVTIDAYQHLSSLEFTYGDWDEMIRWVMEGKVVSENFYPACEENGWTRDFKLKRPKIKAS